MLSDTDKSYGTSSVAENDGISEVLDARGLACPMPLLKAKLALNKLKHGERLKVLATDSGSERDFPAFAKLSGHELLVNGNQDGVYTYVIKKVEAQTE